MQRVDSAASDHAKVDYAKIVDEQIAAQTWLAQLCVPKSSAATLLSSAKSNFDKRQQTLLRMFS